MTCKVYKITNLINNKLYVGITQERYLSRRFWSHANNKRTSGAYIHWSIIKHGKENFTIELIAEYSTPDEAKQKEIEMIALLQLNLHRYPDGIGMNLTDGGDGSYGCKHSPESIKKMVGANNHNYGLTGSKNPTAKAVSQYTSDGEYIQTFGSMREAARHIRPDINHKQEGTVSGNIRSAIIGRKMHQAYGFMWKYV